MPSVPVEIALSNRPHGLNRSVAPQELAETESPDTTDACSYQDYVGQLGPRPGRYRLVRTDTHAAAVSTLTGMGLCVAPWGRYRLLAETVNGVTWHAQPITWQGITAPSLSSPEVTSLITNATAMTGSRRTRFIQYHQRTYAFDGRCRMRAFNGIGWTKAGISGGVLFGQFTPSTSAGSTGITGTYSYYVAAANSTLLDISGRPIEAIPSIVSAPITVTNKTITVGNIPATHEDPQVDTWNIYRTLNGGYDSGLLPDQQDFFLLATIPIGTTSYADAIADSSGWATSDGAFNRLRFNQNIPACFKYGAIYGDRMFGAGFDPIRDNSFTAVGAVLTMNSTYLPDGCVGCYFQTDNDTKRYTIAAISGLDVTLDASYTGTDGMGIGFTVFRAQDELWISEFLNPDAWGPDGEARRYKLAVPGQQIITGLMPYSGVLLVFTKNAIYQVSGKSATKTDIVIDPEPAYFGLGAVGQDAIVKVDNEIHFLSLRGPAVLTASGEPKLHGIVLNTDWLDSLNATDHALCCAGTDHTRVWYSVPVHGQTVASKTFRYERLTDTWWEETETCPICYVNQDSQDTGGDAEDGSVDQLFYLQGKQIYRPRGGTLDNVSAALNGFTQAAVSKAVTLAVLSGNVATLTSAGHGLIVGQPMTVSLSNTAYNGAGATFIITAVNTNTFSYAITHADIGSASVTGGVVAGFYTGASIVVPSGVLPTSDGGLVDCYVRVYGTRNGVQNVFIGSARITSNTATKMIWGTGDTTQPGNGVITIANGDQWEIGNVTWKWLTRSVDYTNPSQFRGRTRLHQNQEAWVTFASKDASKSIYRTDILDGVEKSDIHIMPQTDFVSKYDVGKASFEYACRISSRNGAVIKHVSLAGIQETMNI